MKKNIYTIKKDEQNKIRIYNVNTDTYLDIYFPTKQKAQAALLYLQDRD